MLCCFFFSFGFEYQADHAVPYKSYYIDARSQTGTGCYLMVTILNPKRTSKTTKNFSTAPWTRLDTCPLKAAGTKTRKALNNNDLTQVADQRFSLKQWFAVGAQSLQAQENWFYPLLFKHFPKTTLLDEHRSMLVINSPYHLTYHCTWVEFQLISTWFEGFLSVLSLIKIDPYQHVCDPPMKGFWANEATK